MPRPRNPAPCTAPGCSRPSRAGGLCHAHYQQRVRGRELAPIREPGPEMVLVRARVPRGVSDALREAAGDRPVAELVRDVLQGWAQKRCDHRRVCVRYRPGDGAAWAVCEMCGADVPELEFRAMVESVLPSPRESKCAHRTVVSEGGKTRCAHCGAKTHHR